MIAPDVETLSTSWVIDRTVESGADEAWLTEVPSLRSEAFVDE